jgi:hypothetical protein
METRVEINMKRVVSGNLMGKVAAFALCLFLSHSLFGQTASGAIAGTIVDPKGAVVPGVKVVLANNDTGVTVDTISTSEGYYKFPSVPSGRYSETFTATGFASLRKTDIVVDLNSTSAVNVTLQVGTAEATIQVSADAALIETESADVSTVLTPQEVVDLPLAAGNGYLRNAGAFVFLTPGTYGTGTAGGSVWDTKIGGGQQFGAADSVDGASIQTADFNDGTTFEMLPSVDAIQEFKVYVAGIPAQYGRTGGGVVTYGTKSGTNDLHGSAYEINRNTDYDANSWFNNGLAVLYPQQASSYQRPDDKKNEYGGTFGGPVRIPRLYDGRKKTFFFFSWEQFRQTTGFSEQETVPTNANRAGDFSATLGGPIAGNPINPCTGQVLLTGQIFDPATTQTVGGTPCRTPFTGNKIPSTRFSAVAKNLMALYPSPTNSALINNYQFNDSYNLTDTTETIRIDEAVGERDRMFFSYNVRDYDSPYTSNPSMPEPLAGSTPFIDFFTHIYRFANDYAFSQRLLNHTTLGYFRTNNSQATHATEYGKDWDQELGIVNGFGTGFPGFNFGENMQNVGGGSGDANIDNNTYLGDYIVYTIGKHSITAGGEFRYDQHSTSLYRSASGTFNFGRGETAGEPSQPVNTGNGFASFMLGQPSSISNSLPLLSPRRAGQYSAIYLQDDFKVDPTLTLNLGIRYDVEVPLKEVHNDDANFSPTTPNLGAGGILGSLIYAGSGPGRSGLSSRWVNVYFGSVQPRIGFAWSPSILHGLTVVRGGYQIVTAPVYQGTTIFNVAPGFNSQFSLNDAASGGFTSPQSLDSPLPVLSTTPDLDPTQFNNTGNAIYYKRSFGRPGMAQTWNLEVQEQLDSATVATVSYMGQRGTHLRSDLLYMNDMPQKYFNLGTNLYQNVSGNTVGVPLPYAGFQGTVAQALRPFPQYDFINTESGLENVGQSTYNALFGKVERRMKGGLSLLLSYTWSKQLSDSDIINPDFSTSYAGTGGYIQDPYNLKGEKSVAGSDIPQMLVASTLYQLPFGKGKLFLTHGGLDNAVVGGWTVGVIQRYQSGQPMAFGCATGIPSIDSCIRFNHVAGQNFSSQAVLDHHFNPFTDVYLNSAALADPNGNVGPTGTYGFGNLSRLVGNARIPHYLDEDMSVIKRTELKEGINFELRGEFFNLLNRHVFGFPDAWPQNGPAYGNINYTASTSRQIQFTGRLTF